MISQTSEENKPEVNYNRVKRFVKHVALAAKKQQEKEEAKKHLTSQFEKVKKVSQSKTKKGLEKEIKRLEEKLNGALKKEAALTEKEKKERSLEDDTIKLTIKGLNKQIEELKDKDAYVIETLISQIKDLENDLKITEDARRKEETENKQEVQQLSQSIVDLRSRLKKFMQEKNERDKRVEEIEQKIKEKVGRNYDEIMKIENQISGMEKRYAQLKEKGMPSRVIEKRIGDAKKKLMMKKAGVSDHLDEKKENHASKPIVRKKIPSRPSKPVRHDMHLSPDEEKTKEGKKLPPIPPGPPVPKNLVHDLKKAHEIPTFWDNLLSIFGKHREKNLEESQKKMKDFRDKMEKARSESESFTDKINPFRKKDHIPSAIPPPPPLPALTIEQEEIIF